MAFATSFLPGVQVPMDDSLKIVSDLLYRYANTPHVEFEAKLGWVVDISTRQRHIIPGVASLVPLVPLSIPIAFTSDVGQETFKHITERLQQQQQQQVKEESTTDSFFKISPTKTVRVTKKATTTTCVEKVTMVHQEFSNLRQGCMDFRMSVNKETPYSLGDKDKVEWEKMSPITIRHKKRFSYPIDSYFQIDCTEVFVEGKGSTYEVEVELNNMGALIEEASKVSRGEKNKFLQISTAFLNHIRTLSTIARSSSSSKSKSLGLIN